MSLFRKKDRVIDLSNPYNPRKSHISKIKSSMDGEIVTPSSSSSAPGILGFLGNMASAGTTTKVESSTTESIEIEGNADEKRKKLVRRLMDMTARIEDMSNQLYKLQQRMEVVEKKMKLSKGE